MANNWTVGKKLFTGIGALVFMLVVSGVVAIWSSAMLKDQLDTAVQRTTRKIGLAHRIQEVAVRLRSEERRGLVAAFGKDEETVKKASTRADELITQNEADLDEISTLLVSEDGKRTVAEIRSLQRTWMAADDEVHALFAKHDLMGAWEVARSKANPVVDEIDEKATFLLEQQNTFLKESEETARVDYDRARLILLGALLFSLLVAAGTGMAVRTITRTLRLTATQLREAAEQVVAASSQVSTSAQSLSQGATEQAASLEESSASMEEMGSMTRQNAQNAQQASSLMSEVDRQVAASNALLGDMVTSMNGIRESSGKVSKIIKTIDEIAFQTNILALNAAVEAARAGEAGMGFAVVADEVRTLAQRAAQAARDTASLIEESSASAQQGTEQVERVAGSIAQFTESVGKVKAIADGVSTASQQQAQGVMQVSTAIQEMEKVTQTTAATAEESAAASEELNAQAEMTMQLVEQLEAMVGRADHATASTPGARHRAAPRRSSAERSETVHTKEPLSLHEVPRTGTYGGY